MSKMRRDTVGVLVLAILFGLSAVAYVLQEKRCRECFQKCSDDMMVSCPNNPEAFNRYFLGCAAAQGLWAGSDPWSPDECIKYARKLAGCKETK